jgi:digeranylgeranylglycerophospholipid reductase
MPNLKSDVTVVGAGPAGSTTARIIAEHGYDVTLVDKDEYPWGEDTVEIDLVTVYRKVFDRCLAEKAVDKGARLLANTMIKDVSYKDDKIYLFSDNLTIESKLVVFADGPNTLAYRKFGIGFKPYSDATGVSIACEVKWENNPLDQCEFYYGYDIVPWGCGWSFPRKDTVNVGVACLYSKLNSNLIDSLMYLLNKHPLTGKMFRNKEILQLNSALIPAAPARRIFGERMLVVGDAAGMVDPVTGGGIVHATMAGKLAGEICSISLEKGDFSAKFLSQYQRMWQKTSNYSYIYQKFLVSNIFLYFSKFSRNAYPDLAAVTREGIRKVLKHR